MKKLTASVLAILFLDVSAAMSQDIPAPYSPTKTYTLADRVQNRPPQELALTVIPPDLTLQANVQAVASQQVSEDAEAQKLGAKRQPSYLEGCDPKATRFDWRDKQALSEVRDQGPCGDCFIFASVAAFEASWYIRNKQHIHVSEQQILDCANAGNCSAGGFHSGVFKYLQTHGATSDNEVPYRSRDSGSCTSDSHPYTAVNWSYVDKNGGIASVESIKNAICQHGPVVSAVYASDDFMRYQGGVFNEFNEGRGTSDINHDIVLVGWDNLKDAWILRNSWGSQHWGEEGYMWIRFRSNYVGFAAAWIDAVKVPQSSPSVSEAVSTSSLNRKVQERLFDNTISQIRSQEVQKVIRNPTADLLRGLGLH